MRKLWIQTKDDIYDTAVKVKNLSAKNKPCKDLKRKWATGTYLTLPALEKLIKMKSEELFKKYPEVKIKIDIPLIDKIIIEKNKAALPPVVAAAAAPGAPGVVP